MKKTNKITRLMIENMFSSYGGYKDFNVNFLEGIDYSTSISYFNQVIYKKRIAKFLLDNWEKIKHDDVKNLSTFISMDKFMKFMKKHKIPEDTFELDEYRKNNLENYLYVMYNEMNEKI